MNSILYNEIISDADFTYYQDTKREYQAHYFAPDCVIVDLENKEFVWFNLDYTTVVYNSDTNVRQHTRGSINSKRKFAFSSIDNKMSILEYNHLFLNV